jgi:hypothetical protein
VREVKSPSIPLFQRGKYLGHVRARVHRGKRHVLHFLTGGKCNVLHFLTRGKCRVLQFLTGGKSSGLPPLTKGGREGFVLLYLFLALSACQKLEVGELYALRLDSPPGEAAWEAALPLLMKGGGGNIHGRNERLAELERDTDPVHEGSASCHHGPPITDPVYLEARAYYTVEELYLEIQWEDPTPDSDSRVWKRTGEGWQLSDEDEDGVAVIWSRVAGPFGCQEACHMSDFSLRRGELVDLRAMRMAEKWEWEEAWLWKAARGSRALILDSSGFTTAGEGKTYRTLNSRVAADTSLPPEARRAGTFGPDDAPRVLEGEGIGTAPAYLYAGGDGGGGLTARPERRGKSWRVVFSRRLEAGEERQAFRPGERYRFGVALFDGTSTKGIL